MKNIFVIIIMSLLVFGCNSNSIKLIDNENFVFECKNKAIGLYTLKNSNGLVAQITNFGGRVISLWVPDKKGKFEDVVLGYSSMGGYMHSNEIYYGALIGRYGNRIAKGKFSINGQEYKLATNNNENHLHGGITGFNNVVWSANQVDEQNLELTYMSKDMEEGYPGNLNVKVKYSLTEEDELKIEYWATTDKTTPVNLTHHSFFNLKGAGNGAITDHILQINANSYNTVDQALIPNGKIVSVVGTPMDFLRPRTIGERINKNFDQLVFGLGYDHNWVLNVDGGDIHFAARVEEPKSGRVMEVYTNEPGLQFYSGNFLDGSDKGKEDKTYVHRGAFCLETQHFPDSPNNPSFPGTLLNPDDEYYSICVYKFTTNSKNR